MKHASRHVRSRVLAPMDDVLWDPTASMNMTLLQVAEVLGMTDKVKPGEGNTPMLTALTAYTRSEFEARVTEPALVQAAIDFVRDEDLGLVMGFGCSLYEHSLAAALRSLAHRGRARNDGSPWPKEDQAAHPRLLVDRLLELHPELETVTCAQAVYEWGYSESDDDGSGKTSPSFTKGALGYFLRRRAYAYADRYWNPVHLRGK